MSTADFFSLIYLKLDVDTKLISNKNSVNRLNNFPKSPGVPTSLLVSRSYQHCKGNRNVQILWISISLLYNWIISYLIMIHTGCSRKPPFTVVSIYHDKPPTAYRYSKLFPPRQRLRCIGRMRPPLTCQRVHLSRRVEARKWRQFERIFSKHGTFLQEFLLLIILKFPKEVQVVFLVVGEPSQKQAHTHLYIYNKIQIQTFIYIYIHRKQPFFNCV